MNTKAKFELIESLTTRVAKRYLQLGGTAIIGEVLWDNLPRVRIDPSKLYESEEGREFFYQWRDDASQKAESLIVDQQG